MASTKTLTVLADNVTVNTSAAFNTSVGDLQDGYGAALYIKNTNGATGPSAAPTFLIQGSADNTNYYDFGRALVPTLGNSVVTSWGVLEIPIGAKYLKVYVTPSTGQNTTLRVEMVEVTVV